MLSTIGLIIDIAIVLALVIFGIIGLKKGFLKSVISVFSWGVCILIAFLTAKYVAGWINGIYDFADLIGGKISESLAGTNEYFGRAINYYQTSGVDTLIGEIPAETNGLLKQLIKSIFTNSAVDLSSTETIGHFVGISLGQIIMTVIAGLLVFIVLKIAVALLNKLFDKIAKTKILGGLNKVLGLILGLAKAALIVIALNCVLIALTMIPAVNKTVSPIINENTYVEKFIYNKTDEVFGKYLVEGDMLNNWINDLWQARK